MTTIQIPEQEYTLATYYFDSGHADVIKFVSENCRPEDSSLKKSLDLYYAVRDKIRYNPYCGTSNKEDYRASSVIRKKEGFCVTKAILYAAVLRAAGIPSRVGFANVRNHLSTPRLISLLKTEIFYFHGYTEVFLNNKWVKATTAFNKEICRIFKVDPLDFDGVHDSMFQSYSNDGKEFMEYLHDYGNFPDFPFEKMIEIYKKEYPVFFQNNHSNLFFAGDFEKEAKTKNE